MKILIRVPRVARASQPWAGSHSPVGAKQRDLLFHDTVALHPRCLDARGQRRPATPHTTHHTPHTTHHTPHTTHHSPLTTHHTPLTTHHSPLTRSPLTRSPTRPLAHSPTRPLAHSPTRQLAHSPTRPLAHFWKTGEQRGLLFLGE